MLCSLKIATFDFKTGQDLCFLTLSLPLNTLLLLRFQWRVSRQLARLLVILTGMIIHLHLMVKFNTKTKEYGGTARLGVALIMIGFTFYNNENSAGTVLPTCTV